jgi:hypothetical protein
LVAEWRDLVMVTENESEFETVITGLRETPQSLKISARDVGGDFDLDPDDQTRREAWRVRPSTRIAAG